METNPRSRPEHPVLEQLKASFPVFRECQPLAVGIHRAIRERLPELDAQQLRTAMRLHTQSTRYLKALSLAANRVDLDAAPAGDVTPEQRQQALDMLNERFKKTAERKRLQREQERKLDQEAQQARQRQEKLQQLVRKFDKNG